MFGLTVRQANELVLTGGRCGLGSSRGWGEYPGLPEPGEASSEGDTAADFGRRASRPRLGRELQAEGSMWKGAGTEPQAAAGETTIVGETGKEGAAAEAKFLTCRQKRPRAEEFSYPFPGHCP